jgi:hypothetical protein
MATGFVTGVQNIFSQRASSEEFGAHITIAAGGSTVFGWATTERGSFNVDRPGAAAMMAVLAAKKANPSITVSITFTGIRIDTIEGIDDIRM